MGVGICTYGKELAASVGLSFLLSPESLCTRQEIMQQLGYNYDFAHAHQSGHIQTSHDPHRFKAKYVWP